MESHASNFFKDELFRRREDLLIGRVVRSHSPKSSGYHVEYVDGSMQLFEQGEDMLKCSQVLVSDMRRSTRLLSLILAWGAALCSLGRLCHPEPPTQLAGGLKA